MNRMMKARIDYGGVVVGGDDVANRAGQFSNMRARPVDIGRRIIADPRGPAFANTIPQRVITDDNKLLRFTNV